MPIYEFECSHCGYRFDRLQKLSDPDPSICPECGKPTISRCLTAPAFRLAGSGWYETDFKKDSDKKRNLATSEEPSKPAADKPAATAEAKPKDQKADKKSPDRKPAPAKSAKKTED